MKPLQLLLVSLRPDWCESLSKSLYSAGYAYKIKEVGNKKEALRACNQSKYDALITCCCLPDGSPTDLVQVLGNTMPCLVIRDGCPAGTATDTPSFSTLEVQPPPATHQPRAWVGLVENTIRRWENAMAAQLDKQTGNQRKLYDKAANLCANELQNISNNTPENVLEIILEVLEVSRVYIRDTISENFRASPFVHEVTASGQMPDLGPYRSVYEVALSESDGSKRYLGVEDTITPRTWNKGEAELLSTVATLLKASHEHKTRSGTSWLHGLMGSNSVSMAS
ncbi:hypothetical protein [Salmonirosea aquatica]|uniref:Uncharacterized protein n=1 Tax=Salmonirosea aquatica TaxID=2654236 RepID=A0A7C9FPR7_9BACT|nr:hypothetical protein [Cytophagaceae bacterium SJW1-29]